MLDIIGEPMALALAGALGGLLLGLAARLGRFCSLGAIEDALYGDSFERARMWGVAIGVAIAGTFAAAAAGLTPLAETPYLALAWNPVASVAGGLLFGYGMALSGNCGFGALARFGGGDLRSFVIVVVMGLSAYAVLSGPFAELRVLVFPDRPALGTPPGVAHGIAALTGAPVALIGLGIGLTILALAARGSDLLTLAWGAVVGVAILSGWLTTVWVATHGFAATVPQSHTFAAPLGEAMLWTMTASAKPLSFGVGSVAGVLAGAFIGSLIKGHFRWEACEDPRELRRQVLGAVFMGTGAVVAVGCTVGQGLSAFSVLAWSAPVTAAAIITGAAFGLRQLIAGVMPAE